MKKSLLLFSAVLLMAFSCEKEEMECNQVNACAVANPLQDLPWLKARIADYEQNLFGVSQYYFITQAEYEGETVFFMGNCCPVCLTAPPAVLNCKGDEVFTMGQDVGKDNSIKNKKIIWKGPNFACNP